MIDTPNNCLTRAAVLRMQAAEATLDNVRRCHLAAADAWDRLAEILKAPAQDYTDAPFTRIEAFVRTLGSEAAVSLR
jgi:hypothetical protein